METGLLFPRVRIRNDKDWLFVALHLRLKINQLAYLGSTFKISRWKNENISRFSNFRWCYRFALHYESSQSAESWNFTLLPDKRLGYCFSKLKLILLIYILYIKPAWHVFWRKQRGHMMQELIKIDYFLLHCTSSFKISYLTYAHLRFEGKKWEKIKI